jgi:hypothetical protein
MCFHHMMALISHEYIYMPRDDAMYRQVVGENTARGFPSCIGSIDCVHIGWDQCPTQYTNVYKNFNSLHKQRDINAAFVTCCMLHNMMLCVGG